MVAQPKIKLTAAEYLAIERKAAFRSEFYKGEMFAMAGGSPQHSLIQTNLTAELRRLVKGKCRVFNSDLRVRIDPTGLYTYPDATVICGELQFDVNDDKKETVLNPVLLGEVLSPTSEAYDRGHKFDHYQTIPTFREYLLVSYDAPKIDRFFLTPEGSWTLSTAKGLDASLELLSVPGSLSLAEVYDQVEFPSDAKSVDL